MTNDAGMTFRATVIKADGSRLQHATVDRFVFLGWISEHVAADDVLTIELAASDAAVEPLLWAIRAGAVAMLTRREGDR